MKIFTRENLTIPNLLSLFRIITIPFFVYFYLTDMVTVAIVVLVLGALSDCVDGYIARRFNQITDLAKMLDPLADKLTQAAIAICIAVKYPIIAPVLIFFIIKELIMLVGAIVLLKKGAKPVAANWYGKLGTLMFYLSVTTVVGMTFFSVASPVFEIISYILLGATAVNETLEDAIKDAYKLVKKISFENAYYRNDIGARALKAKGE